MRVIYFDGVCNLCNGFVDFIIRHDETKKFLFSPLQGKTASQNLPPQDLGLGTVVYSADDRVFKKSQAVLKIFSDLGGFFYYLSALGSIVPTFLADQIYDYVARNRYAFFGQNMTCRLPTESEKLRFLD